MRPFPLQKRNFASIDPIIRKWVADNSLHLYTESKGEEVRSVLFCDGAGDVRFHIWIGPLNDNGAIDVHVYEVMKFIHERRSAKPVNFSASCTELRDTLDRALDLVNSKLGQ